MAAPYNLDDTMYNHDWAVREWLREFTVNYGTISGVDRSSFPLITVMASPHRAFAAVADLLTKEGWIAGNTPQMQEARAKMDWPILPLPVASIERDDPIISNELSQVPVQWRRQFFNPSTGSYEVHPAPMYYITQYRVTFWCVKMSTHAAFMEWMLSNLGRRGAGSAEVMLTVKHNPPWNNVLQALRYTGSANLSDLEGMDARHIRSQLSFVMHTWLFRNADYEAAPVYAIKHEMSQTPDKPVYLETFPDSGVWSTANLFTATRWSWPTEGEAEVLSTEPPVQVGVEFPADVAYLCRVLTTPDQFGRSIWSVSFSYAASGSFVVEGTQDDSSGETPTHSFTIPAGTGTFHHFIINTGSTFALRVIGNNHKATVALTNLDVRQLYAPPRITPTGITTVGPDIVYSWSGLERRPYLVVGVLAATGPAGQFNVSVSDDAASPLNTRTEAVSFADCAGFALLTMPAQDSVTLSIPATAGLVSVYVQTFDGAFAGSSV